MAKDVAELQRLNQELQNECVIEEADRKQLKGDLKPYSNDVVGYRIRYLRSITHEYIMGRSRSRDILCRLHLEVPDAIELHSCCNISPTACGTCRARKLVWSIEPFWSGVAPLYSVSRIRHSMEEYQNKRRISIVPVAEATVRLVFSSCCLLLFSHPQICEEKCQKALKKQCLLILLLGGATEMLIFLCFMFNINLEP